MKNKQLVKAAEGAKKDGYEFLAVVIKYADGKPLYHIVNVDVLIKFGRWIPAESKIMEDGATGVKVWANLPPNSIRKSEALRRYK